MSKLLRTAALFLALPTVLSATTIQLIDDERLMARSHLIAIGTIEANADPILENPATDWTVLIERSVKGFAGHGRIVVRFPGGLAPNGLERYVYGTPPLAPGKRVLLFLRARPDGLFELADFPQGVFFEVRTARRSYAMRDWSEVRILPRTGRTGTREPHRDFDRFADWIEDVASGLRRPRDYTIRPSRTELGQIISRFTLSDFNGTPVRWTQFDSGGSVSWLSLANGIPGLAGGGAQEFQRALSVWNNESTTPIRYLYGGTTTNDNGLTQSDFENTVVWNDPKQEMPGPFICSEGGTLAHASPWVLPNSNMTFNGRTFRRIVQGDIVFNDGIECKQGFSPNFSEFIEQVAAHELGHTLGLDHSSENANETNSILKNALMYFRAKDNGQGAVLNSDDIAGIQTIYRRGGATGGGGGGGGTATSGCPAGTPANTLCLLKGRFRVTGTWSNQFNGSSGTAIPITNTDLSGFFYFTDKNNVELILKILDFGTEIKVFYSQLTNLNFTLQVTDTTTGRTKSYSKTPGDCGAIDNNFAAASSALVSAAESLASGPLEATTCVTDADSLCLLGGRFEVTVDWRSQFDGSSGSGRAKALTALTGAFSFSDPANLELLIKTLDFGDHVLVLYGALSNFEYTIRVTEVASGRVKEYRNAAGTFCGGIDNNAF